MAGSFTPIDLSTLPPPDVVETLDYEDILAEMKAEMLLRAPELADVLDLESEPVLKLLQVVAYREILLRQRINDAARSVMLASAVGPDLEQLAALYAVTRLQTDPGDPDAIPPVDPTYEDDVSLRARVQFAPEGFTVAGPANAYKFHALSASGAVVDASVESPTPGTVVVTVLGTGLDGQPGATTLATVSANLDEIRPLSDTVIVQAPQALIYNVNAHLTFFEGPDKTLVMEEAETSIRQLTEDSRKLGRDITLSSIYSALHVSGVQNVTLNQPSGDISVSLSQVAILGSLTLTDGGYGD